MSIKPHGITQACSTKKVQNKPLKDTTQQRSDSDCLTMRTAEERDNKSHQERMQPPSGTLSSRYHCVRYQ